MRLSLLVGLGALFLSGLWGCQTTRADHRDDIAESVCDQMQQCGAFGSNGAEFADYDDCMTEVKATYNDLWPADECGNGRIDETKFNQCKSRAIAQACDENVLDAISFQLECGAGDVCVSAPSK